MSAPVPSGRATRVHLHDVVQHVERSHDNFYLQNANNPKLLNDPGLQEFLARQNNLKLNQELEHTRSVIRESKAEIRRLRQKHAEQLETLNEHQNAENQLKEEVRKLKSDNQALNKTLIDMTINKTGDITITEDSTEFNLLQKIHIESSQIGMLRDAIVVTTQQAENADKRMKKLQECYDLQEEKSKQKIAALQAQLNDAMIEIDDKDETIKANISLNQTINIDMAKLELFKDKYDQTLKEFKQAKLESKSRTEEHLRSTVKFQKEYKVIQDKEQKTATALAALTNQLKREKLENAAVTNKYKHSRRMFREEHDKKSKWIKISEEQEAKNSDLAAENLNLTDANLDLTAENMDLMRELAESRMANNILERKVKKIGCFGRFFKI